MINDLGKNKASDGQIDPFLLELLACPVTGENLRSEDGSLVTQNGRQYPVIDGVPILMDESFGESGSGSASYTYRVLCGELQAASESAGDSNAVEAIVQDAIAATGGNLYRRLRGRLPDYPIPDLPSRSSAGEILLDIGCHWGRWTIAAARAGYRAIGIDPSVNAVLAARRVAKKLGVRAWFIVGDGRHLPFRDVVVDDVFSFSVLQHFSREDVLATLEEVKRVLVPGGHVRVQMPNRYSLLGMFHQSKRGFREGRQFEVRYWSVPELKRAFSIIGSPHVDVDAFFSLNAQKSDLPLMPLPERMIVCASLAAKSIGTVVSPLKYVADSLWCVAEKP